MECFQTRLEGVSYARLPSRRSKAMAGVDDALIDQVMELRSVMKDGLKDLQKQYFDIPSEEQFAQLRATAELVRTYVQVPVHSLLYGTADSGKAKKKHSGFCRSGAPGIENTDPRGGWEAGSV